MDNAMPDMLVPSAADRYWSAYEQALQLPLIVATGWWNAMIDLMAAPARCHALHVDHVDHDQLAVPEPLDEDTRPSLFA